MTTNHQTRAKSICPCPPAGDGVHRWVYGAYCQLTRQGASHHEAAAWLRANATRALTSGDIPNEGHAPRDEQRHYTRRPEFAPRKLQRLAARQDGFDTEALWWKSPLRPDTRTPASFLHAIFEPGERVLCFSTYASQGQAIWTRPGRFDNFDANALDAFTRPAEGAGAWFLSNPVEGEWRELDRLKSERNPTGRTRRAEPNLTAFRFLVVESDEADPAQWLAGLIQLPLPIASVCTSAGRGSHALVRLDAQAGEEWRELAAELKPALVTLGGDASAMSAVRLTRLPACWREEKSGWQTLLYLNPAPNGTPICELPDREPRAEALERWRTAEAAFQ